jgi:hypothetical protein
MSSLLRPVGHLPASVYWFRRALVLVVLAVLLFVLLRLFGGGGSGDAQNSAAPGPQQNPTTAPPDAPTATSASSSGATTKKTEQPGKTTQPARDAECTGSDVRVEVLPANRKIVSGSAVNFVLRLTGVSQDCKAPLDPGLLSVTVTSGNDQIWTTSQCEQAIPHATLAVAKGKQVVSTVPWNGRRSAPGCLPGQPPARPGTYVVKAVFDGRASTEQAFQVV